MPQFHNLNFLKNKFFLKLFKYYKVRFFLEPFFRFIHWDNSFKLYSDIKNIDLICIAGSPEWDGFRLKPLYALANKHNIPICFIGIGSWRHFSFNSLQIQTQKALSRSSVTIVRDRIAHNALKDKQAQLLTCPSISCAKNQKVVLNKDPRIALVYVTSNSVPNNAITKYQHKILINVYKEIITKFNIEFICHYQDEIDCLYATFGKSNQIHYSYDAADYFDIYSKFDFVVSPRVHGVGIASSLSIPSLHLGHDHRSHTIKEFETNSILLSESKPSQILSKIDDLLKDLNSLQKQLIYKRNELESIYIDQIKHLF